MLDDTLALQNTMQKEERANSKNRIISTYAARLGKNKFAAIHKNLKRKKIKRQTVPPKYKEQGSDSEIDPAVRDGELTQEDALHDDYPSETHKVLSFS